MFSYAITTIKMVSVCWNDYYNINLDRSREKLHLIFGFLNIHEL